MVHIYNGILLSHKKEWNNDICSHMEGPRDYNSKWSKADRERQISYDTAYMWNLKNNTNECISKTNRLTDIENRHSYQRGGGEG